MLIFHSQWDCELYQRRYIRAQQNAKWVVKTQWCGSLHKDDHRMGKSGHGKLCGEDREVRKLANPLVLLHRPSHSALLHTLPWPAPPLRWWRQSPWRGERPPSLLFCFCCHHKVERRKECSTCLPVWRLPGHKREPEVPPGLVLPMSFGSSPKRKLWPEKMYSKHFKLECKAFLHRRLL